MRRSYALPTSDLPIVPEKGLATPTLKDSIPKRSPLIKFLEDWKNHCIAAERLRQQNPTYSLYKISPRAMQLPHLPIPDFGTYLDRPDLSLDVVAEYLKNTQVNWMFSESPSNRHHNEVTYRIILVMAAEHQFWIDNILPLLVKSPSFLDLLESLVKSIKASKNFKNGAGLLSHNISMASQASQSAMAVDPKEKGGEDDNDNDGDENRLEDSIKNLFTDLKDRGLILPNSNGLIHPALCNLLHDFVQGCRDIQGDISQMGRDLAKEDMVLRFPPEDMEVPAERLKYFENLGIEFTALEDLQKVVNGGTVGKRQGQKRKLSVNEGEGEQ